MRLYIVVIVVVHSTIGVWLVIIAIRRITFVLCVCQFVNPPLLLVHTQILMETYILIRIATIVIRHIATLTNTTNKWIHF